MARLPGPRCRRNWHWHVGHLCQNCQSAGLASAFYRVLIAAAALFLLYLPRGKKHLPSPADWGWVVLGSLFFTGFSLNTWLALIGLGLVPQFAGWLVINYAIGHLPAAHVSVTLLGQVLVTAILGFLLLSESPSPADIIGGVPRRLLGYTQNT